MPMLSAAWCAPTNSSPDQSGDRVQPTPDVLYRRGSSSAARYIGRVNAVPEFTSAQTIVAGGIASGTTWRNQRGARDYGRRRAARFRSRRSRWRSSGAATMAEAESSSPESPQRGLDAALRSRASVGRIAALAASHQGARSPSSRKARGTCGRYNELTGCHVRCAQGCAAWARAEDRCQTRCSICFQRRTGRALLERVDHGLKAPLKIMTAAMQAAEQSRACGYRPVFWVVTVLLLASAGFVPWPQRAARC